MKKYPISRAVVMISVFIIFGIYVVQNAAKPTVVALDNFDVIRVYDGDTFYVTFPCWHPIVGEELGIRINGVDTPEMRTKSYREKYLAGQAKDYVVKRLESAQHIQLRNIKRGKYFRLVADVFVDNKNIAVELIDLGLAVPYDGGTKTKDWSK